MKGGGLKNNAKATAALKTTRSRHNSRMEKVLKVETFVPEPPAHFTEIQMAKWHEIVKRFADAKIWERLDYDAMQAYVENWCLMDELMNVVQSQGAVVWIETPGGKKPIRNPAHIAYMEAFKVVKPLMEQFGMTPRARQSIIVKPKDDTPDPLDGL